MSEENAKKVKKAADPEAAAFSLCIKILSNLDARAAERVVRHIQERYSELSAPVAIPPSMNREG